MIDTYGTNTMLELLAPGQRTATGNGSAVDVKDYLGLVAVVLNAASVSGSDRTLDVKIQDSADGLTGWNTVAQFTQITTTSVVKSKGLRIDNCARYIRARFVIGGIDPVFDFNVVLIGRKQEQS